MAYTYKSFTISPNPNELPVDQLAAKIQEFVPGVVVEGPFYYRDDGVTYPNPRSYTVAPSLDSSFKIVLINSDYMPTPEGKPSQSSALTNYILMRVIANNQVAPGAYVQVGALDGYGSGMKVTGDPIYITFVIGEDYLLWNISESVPYVNMLLYTAYEPLYLPDGSLYGLTYPAIKGYYKGNSTAKTFNSFKDTLLTQAGLLPTTNKHVIAIASRESYAYPELDFTQNGSQVNYKPTLTKKVPMFIQTVYGDSSSISGGESNRRVTTNLHGRECMMLVAKENSPTYPKGSILVIDNEDYYVCTEKSINTEGGFASYKLFRL